MARSFHLDMGAASGRLKKTFASFASFAVKKALRLVMNATIVSKSYRAV
jgi:hypothetical protein